MQGATSIADIRKRARWYVTVRWFYVLAIAIPSIVTLVASGGLRPQVLGDMVIVGAILLVNAGFLAGTYTNSTRRVVYELLVMGQVVLDIAIVSAAFYVNAGIETQVALLYAIPIIMTAAFFTRVEVYMTGVTATAAFVALALLDHIQLVVDRNIAAPALHIQGNNFYPTFITTCATLLVITAITGLVSELIQERERMTLEMHALVMRHAETEAILRTMGSALVAVNRQGAVTMVNDSFERLTGWKRVEVVGRLLDNVLPILDAKGERVEAAHRPMLRYMVDNKLASPPGVRTVAGHSYVRKDGSIFPFFGQVAPIVSGGKVIGFTTVFDDATENKKVDQLKDNFIALISHQLKTPIGEINGYAYNLLGGIGGPLNDKQTEYVTHIQELAARAGKLIVDLLDIVLAGRGNLTVHNEPVELGPVIELVAKVRQDRVAKKGLSIKVDMPVGLLFVRGDDQKLIQAIGNIVDNAIAYSKKGAITISVVAKDETTDVMVSDEGGGMDQATVRALFEGEAHDGPLAHAPTAEGGTGLGVYLARQLIALMNGSIRVASTSRHGTTICVTLQRVKP